MPEERQKARDTQVRKRGRGEERRGAIADTALKRYKYFAERGEERVTRFLIVVANASLGWVGREHREGGSLSLNEREVRFAFDSVARC